jgi:hypothetical protein
LLIQIDGCIHFNQFQREVKLPIKNVEIGSLTTIIGWGLTSYPSGSPSEILKKADMIIIETRQCNRSIQNSIRDGQVCAYHKKGVGSCIVSLNQLLELKLNKFLRFLFSQSCYSNLISSLLTLIDLFILNDYLKIMKKK